MNIRIAKFSLLSFSFKECANELNNQVAFHFFIPQNLMKTDIITFQNVANVGFGEKYFIQCILGKDEKHSRQSENFLDAWAD